MKWDSITKRSLYIAKAAKLTWTQYARHLLWPLDSVFGELVELDPHLLSDITYKRCGKSYKPSRSSGGTIPQNIIKRAFEELDRAAADKEERRKDKSLSHHDLLLRRYIEMDAERYMLAVSDPGEVIYYNRDLREEVKHGRISRAVWALVYRSLKKEIENGQ